MTYVALLRGINVGGKNIIKMDVLKQCFVSLGFNQVSTYIQSGNVMFQSSLRNRERLTQMIEQALFKAFKYQALAVVVSVPELKSIIQQVPKGFGTKPKLYRYDVLFLKHPLAGKVASQHFPLRAGVDTLHVGKHVLYHSRLISKATHSKLSKIVALPMYKQLTIRNWNTTTKLLGLMADISTTN